MGDYSWALKTLEQIENAYMDFDYYNLCFQIYKKMQDIPKQIEYIRKAMFYKALDPKPALIYLKLQQKVGLTIESDRIVAEWIHITHAISAYSPLRKIFVQYFSKYSHLSSNNNGDTI